MKKRESENTSVDSAPWWLRLLAYSRTPGNVLAYWARRWAPYSRPFLPLPAEELTGLFDDLPEQLRAAAYRREEELRAHYRLAALREGNSRFVYLRALWLLTVWEEALTAAHKARPELPLERAELQVVDVGSLSWDYVFALERFWSHYPPGVGARAAAPRQVRLLGLEVNGRARDGRGVTHACQAQAYAEQTGNDQVGYRVGDFLRLTKEELLAAGADVVTVFFPFLFPYGALLWGLPPWLCRPLAILRQAATLLRPGGVLLLLVHTPAEHRRLLELATRIPSLYLAATGPAACQLFPHGDPELLAGRHYAVLVKGANNPPRREGF